MATKKATGAGTPKVQMTAKEIAFASMAVKRANQRGYDTEITGMIKNLESSINVWHEKFLGTVAIEDTAKRNYDLDTLKASIYKRMADLHNDYYTIMREYEKQINWHDMSGEVPAINKTDYDFMVARWREANMINIQINYQRLSKEEVLERFKKLFKLSHYEIMQEREGKEWTVDKVQKYAVQRFNALLLGHNNRIASFKQKEFKELAAVLLEAQGYDKAALAGIGSQMDIEKVAATIKNAFLYAKDMSKVSRGFQNFPILLKTACAVSTDFTCSICHQSLLNEGSGSKTHLDHLYAHTYLLKDKISGGNTFSNLYPAHDNCNSDKKEYAHMLWAIDSSPVADQLDPKIGTGMTQTLREFLFADVTRLYGENESYYWAAPYIKYAPYENYTSLEAIEANKLGRKISEVGYDTFKWKRLLRVNLKTIDEQRTRAQWRVLDVEPEKQSLSKALGVMYGKQYEPLTLEMAKAEYGVDAEKMLEAVQKIKNDYRKAIESGVEFIVRYQDPKTGEIKPIKVKPRIA